MEVNALKKELEDAEKLIKKYSKLLESKSNMKKQMIADMLEIKEKYAIPRKTVIADCGEVVVKKAQAVETEVAVLLDRFYYIKVVDANLYDKNKAQIDKDYRFSFKCKNTERVGVFADNNQMYMIKVADIIKLQAKKNIGKKGNGSGLIGRLSDKGIQIFEFCNMNGNENILYMCCIEQIIDKNLLFVTKHGQAKLVPGNNYDVLRKMIVASKQEEDIIFIHDAEMEDFIVVKSMLGYYARIQISEIPVKGKGAGCIRLVNITDDDEIEEVAVGSTKDSFFVDNTEILFTRIKACKRGSKGTKLRL